MEQPHCSEKLVFETKEQAEGAKTHANYQYGNKLKPYECSGCGLWHLASA